MNWKVAVSKRLKRSPPLFDLARRTTRLWEQTPIYQLLAKASRNLPEVGFIQIGANDGMSVDPIREFVVANAHWHGALVEPVPQIFALLRRNYSYLEGKRRLAFFNVAVSNEEGAQEFWKIKDEYLREFPLFAYGVGSFDREHIVRHFPNVPNLESKLQVIQVPCRTYQQIREQAGLADVHLLHMDVEGHESRILESIDLSHSAPLIILFEISHMEEPTRARIFGMLQNLGYRIEIDGADCLETLRSFD